jgi:hypothetical protein
MGEGAQRADEGSCRSQGRSHQAAVKHFTGQLFWTTYHQLLPELYKRAIRKFYVPIQNIRPCVLKQIKKYWAAHE